MPNYANLKEKSYHEIKKNIIDLTYKPGEYLEEKKLIESFGVSRTPMREAINKLEEEGWVTNYPRKGIYVTLIDEKLINDVFNARKNIEVSSLKLGVENLSKIKLKILKEKFSDLQTNQIKTLDDLDHEFHNMILGFYNNYFLEKISINIMEHASRIKMYSLGKKLKARIIESTDEHIKLIDLILEGKVEDATTLLYSHLEKAQIYYLKILISE